jgi:hypothetical protein
MAESHRQCIPVHISNTSNYYIIFCVCVGVSLKLGLVPHLCDNANNDTTHKLFFTTMCSLPGAASISSRSFLAIESVVYTRTKFVVWGRRYSVGNVLLLGKCQVQHELKFGLIHEIIYIQEQLYVYFLVKKFNTLGYHSSVNTYLVKKRDGSDPSDFSCVTVKSDLLD